MGVRENVLRNLIKISFFDDCGRRTFSIVYSKFNIEQQSFFGVFEVCLSLAFSHYVKLKGVRVGVGLTVVTFPPFSLSVFTLRCVA